MTPHNHLLAVSEKIENYVDAIAKNGSLQESAQPGRKPFWVLRFRTRCPKTGASRQHSISLGRSPELRDLVTQLLKKRDSITSERRAQKQAGVLKRRHCRQMTRELLARVEGSGRYRRTVAQAFRAYFNSTAEPSIAEFMPLLDKPPLKRRGRGRPFKKRLW